MKKKKKRQFQRLKEKHIGAGIEAKCNHFGRCGGCMFQDMAYESQLELKRDYVNTIMEGYFSISKPATPACSPFSFFVLLSRLLTLLFPEQQIIKKVVIRIKGINLVFISNP